MEGDRIPAESRDRNNEEDLNHAIAGRRRIRLRPLPTGSATTGVGEGPVARGACRGGGRRYRRPDARPAGPRAQKIGSVWIAIAWPGGGDSTERCPGACVVRPDR